MAGESVKKDSQPVAKQRPIALLFDLEHSAVDGRSLFFDISKRLLAEREIELTPALFMRHFRKQSMEKCLDGLLEAVGKKRLSAAKLAGEITEELKVGFTDKRLKMPAGFAKLVAQAKAEEAIFGALTALPNEVADDLIKRLGLDGVL
ncbi:MAG: hypothetical protein WCL44_03760, partial [bacterium]